MFGDLFEGTVRNAAAGNSLTPGPANMAVDGLSSFDTQLLNSYLSSIATATDAGSQNMNEMSFVNDGRRYNVIQVADGQEQSATTTTSDGQMYGEMLTFNKQFTGTPNVVYCVAVSPAFGHFVQRRFAFIIYR